MRIAAIAALVLLSPGLLKADRATGSFSPAQLDGLILGLGIQRLSDVVPRLPDFLRANLTFVFESQSAQEAHWVFEHDAQGLPGVDSPRAIVWDSQGKFFLTFNSHEGASGFNTIETSYFDESGAIPRFTFRARDFSPEARPAAHCTACHGTESRPIWGEYPTWSGVYGSREDILQPEEAPRYAEFRAHALGDPLYRSLFPPDAWPNFPVKKDADVNVMSESHTFHYRPNTRMSILLNRLNASRIVATLKAHPSYATDRAELAYRFLGCGEDAAALALLGRYGLSMRDLDLRHPYFDPSYETMAFSDSYFDGASTLNELVAAALLGELSEQRPELAATARFQTLGNLYFSNYHRELDGDFMAAADGLGSWIRTPFPAWQAKTKLRPRPNALELESVRQLCALLKP